MNEGSRERQIESILHAYLQAIDAGQPVDRDAVLRQHPEFADDLREFFADQQRMDQFFKSMHKVQVGDVTIDVQEPGAADSAMPHVRNFGDYELLEEIARGGMGVVYKARQVSLNRIVALKMILAGQFATAVEVQRFHIEAEAAANLDHPNIVPIYEVGEHEGRHYFSMKLIAQGSRFTRPKSGHRHAVRFIAMAARAVHYAHQRGIIHRDLKPANILVDAQGQPHITDFGLAKRLEGDANLSQSGAIVGTPAYMAPEQAAGGKGLTTAADVYSLGAILYELLTGKPPFAGATPMDILLQVMDREPTPPRQVDSSIDRDLETICLKSLAKDPQMRYGTAEALAEDLERFQAGEPILARPVGAVGRAWRWCRRKPALAGSSALAGTALLVTMVLAVVFAMVQYRAADHNRLMLAESYLDRGQALCEQGDVARGLLWFARSLETAPGSATDLQRAIRANLGAWHVPGARLRNVLTGAPNVTAVAMSLDGKTLMTAHQNEMRLWDVATGAPIGAPLFHKAFQHTGSFSADGKLFAAGGMDSSSDVTAVIWDTATRKPIQSLRLRAEDFRKGGFNPNAKKTAFSPDGKVLVTTNYQNVRIWDVATGRPIGPTFRRADGDVVLHKDWIEALALSPNGKVLATGSRDKTVRLWNVTTGMPLGEPLLHEAWVRSVAFSPDGKTLLSGAFDGTARLWDVTTGKVLGAPLIHRGFIYAVTFSPDGRRVLTGAGNVTGADGENSARLWDVTTHKPIGMALHHSHYVEAVAFSPDGKSLVTSGGGDVCVWDLPESQPA